jgi:hypothetical protein
VRNGDRRLWRIGASGLEGFVSDCNALMHGNAGTGSVFLYLLNKDLMQAVICPRRKKLSVDQWSGRQLHVIGTRLCHILQLIYHSLFSWIFILLV